MSIKDNTLQGEENGLCVMDEATFLVCTRNLKLQAQIITLNQ